MPHLPVVMTIAGSDPSGGAGIAADLKTFAALGVFGTFALTGLTAQNTRGVLRVEAVAPDLVAAQIEALREDFAIAAVKTGMLTTEAIAEVVARQMEELSPPWLVVDPVALSSGGESLFEGDARRAMVESILPLSPVLTPNLPEAETLLQEAIGPDTSSRINAAHALVGMGPRAVLLKGGHVEGPWAEDVLVTADREWVFSSERITAHGGHGTGCTLSAALTAFLALGRPLPAAAVHAKEYLTGALERALEVGSGEPPLHHFHAYDPPAGGTEG